MRRIASHYIYWRRWYRMHYLELDAEGCFTGVYPLEQEIADTEFYDGTLIPVPADIVFPAGEGFVPAQWVSAADTVTKGAPVSVYRLAGFTPATSELGTDNGSGDCHIQRL